MNAACEVEGTGVTGIGEITRCGAELDEIATRVISALEKSRSTRQNSILLTYYGIQLIEELSVALKTERQICECNPREPLAQFAGFEQAVVASPFRDAGGDRKVDLSDAVIRSLAAIDMSRNRQQATVLLNFHCRKLIAQAKFSVEASQRTRQEMRESCDKLVSSSFTAIARTGDLLERWNTPPHKLTTNGDRRPAHGNGSQTDVRFKAAEAA